MGSVLYMWASMKFLPTYALDKGQGDYIPKRLNDI